MKKTLLLTCCFAMLCITMIAQVTQINSNQSLEIVGKLNDVKTLFSSGIDGNLWVSEGDLASTQKLSTAISLGGDGLLLGSKFIFAGFSASTGIELFITDGTPLGTLLLKEIVAGNTGSLPDDFVVLNGFVYFSAETTAEGRELWRTDGTPSGTTFVKDINPGPAGSNNAGSFSFTPLENSLLFSAKGNANGIELWRTDGTTGGTVMVKDINPGAADGGPDFFWPLGNLIIFQGTTLANGTEFWRTDGTEAGTFLLKDINPGAGSSAFVEIEISPGVFIPFPFLGFFNVFNGKAYFQATDGVNNGNVYVTDGTTANTTLLKTIVPGSSVPIIFLFNSINLPGKFIFSVADESSAALWQSDGTTNGTTIFKSFFVNSNPDFPILFKDFSNMSLGTGINTPLFQGNKFFFSAPTEAEGNELWISDGTPGGTSLVKNIGAGNASGIADDVSYLNATTGLYFTANNGTNGSELWKSDGTEAGTSMVQDINTGAANASPGLMILNNGKIFFGAKDGNNDAQTDLFVVNGSFSLLPVNLGNFSVTRQGADALLNWETKQEVNTSHFTIERSSDALEFQSIGTVSAKNRFNTAQQYHFTDYKLAFPPSGKLYYRLVTHDKDGEKSFSKVIALSGNSVSWDVKLLGNSPGAETKLQITGAEKSFVIRITDQSGKVLYSGSYSGSESEINLNLPNLSRGIYHLTVYRGNETKTLRFIR